MLKLSRALLTVLMGCISLTGMTQDNRYLIEAESFQFKGKWVVEQSNDCLGSAMLRVFEDKKHGAEEDALTVVDIKQAGTYAVWTRSYDSASNPKKRKYKVTIDGQAMATSGTHSRDGFYWEKVGELALTAKQTLLRIHDATLFYARCDAILLTTDLEVDPNDLTKEQISAWRKAPDEMTYETEVAETLPAAQEIKNDYVSLANVKNDSIRISFVKPTADSDRIVCKTDFWGNGNWRRFVGKNEDNRLMLIVNTDGTKYNHTQRFPAWDYCSLMRRFELDGVTYEVRVDGDNTNPYYAGEQVEAVVTAVEKTSSNTLKVTYECGSYATIVGYWTVPESGTHIEVRFVLTAQVDGMFSMALLSTKPVESATNVLLPPMFQYQRMMDTPKMLLSGMMQQPVAIVETSMSFGKVSAFVSADMRILGNDWGGFNGSPIGFTLLDQAGEIQPVAFAPVLGATESDLKEGETVETRFVTGVISDTWNNTLEYVSDHVFKVSDYRQQTDTSLTDALFNMNDLMNDDSNSGWNAAMKGFWDIEKDGSVQPTVVQTSPLAVVSQALLSHDEEQYIKRALPTIEYTLSRAGYRWTTSPGATPAMTPLSSQFTTSYYVGLNELLNRKNPWLSALALPSGNIRTGTGYSTQVLSWRQALAAYQLTGEESWLTTATSGADSFINDKIYSNTATPISWGTFYHSSVFGPWWQLIDLYEVTGDERYKDAASYGSAHTLAGIRSYPQVKNGQMTIHANGVYEGISTIWWKGAEQYRLGFPRTEGDVTEHDVDIWKVSPVGLGFEQPTTFFPRVTGNNNRPVYMNSWAPHLLRLSAQTGKSIYETYARNAVIGRSGNYPGYYATGYTDVVMKPDFPTTGPDVSSIYYHHIPAHMAFTEDFLLTEMINRSQGNIQFPYGLQEGFVWFANRLYGDGVGTVFGEQARLWMKRGLASVSNVQMNYVTALSDSHFWVLLTNESGESQSANVQMGDVVTQHLAGTTALVYTTNGSCTAKSMSNGTLAVTVPARGLLAIAVPVSGMEQTEVPILENGMKILETNTPAGKIYLYRIRSPFGWDSVYGVAEASQTDGMSIQVNCNGSVQTIDHYPYEWRFMKYDYDQQVEVQVKVLMNGSIVGEESSSFAETPANVFVKHDADGTGDGTSWESALNSSQFLAVFNNGFPSGTAFYLSGGTYELASTLTTNKAFTLKGGYPTTLTGTSVPTPDGKTPTVLKGDGTIIGLLEINMSSTTTYANDPVVIDGINFTNAQGAGGAGDGALKVSNSQNLTVSNCHFYENISTDCGISAYLLNTTARFVDCTFHDNSAKYYGAALRLNATNTTKGITTLERCRIFNNNTTVDSQTYGSAVCVMNAKCLNIVNTAIFGNTAATAKASATNGAVYLAGQVLEGDKLFANQLVVMNSAIAGNNHHQIYQAGNLNVKMANSIVSCPTDDHGTRNAAIYCGTANTFLSGGYNIIGSVVAGSSAASPDLQETDIQKNGEDYYNCKAVFGLSSYKDPVTSEVIQSPIAPNGVMSVSDAQTLATSWSIPATVDLSVDNEASIRIATKPGAFDPLTKTVTIAEQYATFYSDYGYVMPENVEGAIVTSTGDYSIVSFDYNFLAGEFIPGGTPLVLKGTAGDYTLKMKKAGDASTKAEDNLLLGTEEEATTTSEIVSAKFYKLSNGSNGIGFYWAIDGGAAFTNAANKAYLALPGYVSARYFSLDGMTTIHEVEKADDRNTSWYTLQGVAIAKPVCRGIYINKGKKKIIK